MPRRRSGIIGAVAVHEHVSIRFDVGEHAPHDVALCLGVAHVRTIAPAVAATVRGIVRRVVVVDVDGGVWQRALEVCDDGGDRRRLVVARDQHRHVRGGREDLDSGVGGQDVVHQLRSNWVSGRRHQFNHRASRCPARSCRAARRLPPAFVADPSANGLDQPIARRRRRIDQELFAIGLSATRLHVAVLNTLKSMTRTSTYLMSGPLSPGSRRATAA